MASNGSSGDFDASASGIMEAEQAAQDARQAFNAARESVSELGKEISDLNKNLQKDFSDSIKGAIKNGTDFSGVFDKLRDTIEDFVVQMAVVNPALNALFGGDRKTLGDIGGGSFPSGGIINSLFSNIFGLLDGRAAGGPVNAGTPYIVGERGPELFVPQTSGSINPNAGGGGVNITMNITANDAGSFRSSQAQITASMLDAVRKAQRIR